MPGRIMDHNGLVGSNELKKDRSQAQEGGPSPVESHASALQASRSNGVAHHGPDAVRANGIASNGPHIPNGAPRSEDDLMGGLDLAPQLDRIWRQSGEFPSLGTIMSRQAQHCYQNLSRCLTAMTEISVEPQQANGVLSHSVQDTSKSSQQKKRLLMGFAKEQREFFTKSLVLVDWCRNADDIYKLKDVDEWQKRQLGARETAADAFLRMQMNMVPAKMPNPNIKGAMELLSTSKASWIPDLGYLPAKRLPAKQLLETLRNMNVILATRLLVHEDLPHHMHDYTIADGRATFTVKDEFAVDLTVADEDPARPFYFIDTRLLYSPSSNALDTRFRAQAEWRINHLLATKGLKGAYEFLHNFVLTHKINILRSQAANMIRGKWFDCIRVENLRRNFIVQYWVETPGKRSWIEFGVSSAKSDPSILHEPTSRISVRWFRQGVRVDSVQLDFDWKNLDLERCVQAVIRLHTTWLLENMRHGIDDLVAAQPASLCESNSLVTDAGDSVLSLRLRGVPKPLTVRVEPVTGQMVISPPSRATREAEQRLNNDVSADRVKWVASLICAAAQDKAHKAAQLLGWVHASGLARQDNLHVLLGGKARFSIFVPNPAWGRKWALAVTFGLGGEKWWVVQLEEKRDERGAVGGRIVATSRPLSVGQGLDVRPSLSKDSLLVIEKTAVAEVAFASLSGQLKRLSVPHQIQRLGVPRGLSTASTRGPTVAMMIELSPLMSAFGGGKWKPWADETMRLTHHGLVGDYEANTSDLGNVRHDLRLSLLPDRMEYLAECSASSGDRDLAIHSTGGLALKLLTPFGQPFIQQMQTRLHNLERLNQYVGLLKRLDFECVQVSLSRLAFVYNKVPRLVAELSLGESSSQLSRLRLEPPGSNPHQRIRAMLEQGLKQAGQQGFSTMLHILTMTLPLIQAFERQETSPLFSSSVAVHPRSPTWFTVKYKAPLPTLTFQIRLNTKTRGDSIKAVWHVQYTRLPDANVAALPEDVSKALSELWQSKEEHWLGVGNALIADVTGIGQCVDRIDELARRFAAAPPTGADAEPPAQPEPQATTTTPNKVEDQKKPPLTAAAKQSQGGKPQPNGQPQRQQQPKGNGVGAKSGKDQDVIMLD